MKIAVMCRNCFKFQRKTLHLLQCCWLYASTVFNIKSIEKYNGVQQV